MQEEPEFAEKLIYTCLTMMTEVGEDDEDGSIWTSQDDLSNADEDEEIYSASKHSLDRLALKLGGEVVLPKLFLWLPQLASSTQWRERHAALMALSNVAEGCASVMIPKSTLSSISSGPELKMNTLVFSGPPLTPWVSCY